MYSQKAELLSGLGSPVYKQNVCSAVVYCSYKHTWSVCYF